MATTLSELRQSRVRDLHDGAKAARQRAVDIDRALLDLYVENLGNDPRVSLIAVGGYGRGELSPHSDIDLLFLAPPKDDGISKATLRNVLYPLWDAGFQVGHAVFAPKQAIERTNSDLHLATALLSARLVAGPPEHFEELIDRLGRAVSKNKRAMVRRVTESTEERHRTAERAGWTLAPDLKNDIGGLRDVHTAQWLAAITGGNGTLDTSLMDHYDVLLSVREGLHGEVPRKVDSIRIDLQAQVAARLGLEGPDGRDALMEAVHSAARAIEHRTRLLFDGFVDAALTGPRRSGSVTRVNDTVVIEDGRLRTHGVIADRPSAVRTLAAVAETGRLPDAGTVEKLQRFFDDDHPGDWEEATLEAFISVLKGPYAEIALELLDTVGGWRSLLPEWSGVRGRAQHDPYHRFTVDGHSFRAVASIRRFADTEELAAAALGAIEHDRTLYVATLLHDVGKGSGEDHSVAGARMSRSATKRMGLCPEEMDDVETLVRHHLLLSDTATRRDIDDGSVVASVSAAIADARLLRCLYVLSGADGMATGQGSWTDWKASLVAALYRRVLLAIESGELPQRSDVGSRLKELEIYDPLLADSAGAILPTLPPSYLASTSIEDVADDLRLLQEPPELGRVAVRIDRGTESNQSVITACFTDRPGSLARTAGVLTLHRMSVLSAQAYTTTGGLALERFIVQPLPETDWEQIETDLGAAYSGRLALDARIAQKTRDYRPQKPPLPDIRILHDESEHSTVIEVRSGDALGLLYAICSAITELDLNIHVAKIDTLGERVVDVFYLRNQGGSKLDDVQGEELRRAILYRVQQLFA